MNDSGLNRPPATAAAIWKQRYEALRQLAVAEGQIFGVDPLDFVLLLRQGVAGWMRHWSGLASEPPKPLLPAPPEPPAPTPQWQQQLTQLLAQMSLAHLPKECT